MNQATEDQDQDRNQDRQQLVDGPPSVSAVFEGSESIREARDRARSFLAEVQNLHGLTVSGLAVDLVELVVSELVTNARKYAPGPYLLTLEVQDGSVEVSVWDSNPTPPSILPPDPQRIGQHGLEIVMATARGFHIQREPVGKRITASITLADPADPADSAAPGAVGREA